MASTLVIASDPKELAAGQHRLIDQMSGKIEAAVVEAQEAKGMVAQMQTAGLNASSARRMHRRATARVTFLTKVRSALAAGYVMMPDMPGDVVAVRTDKENPPDLYVNKSGTWNLKDVMSRSLPEGDGKYVSQGPRYLETSEAVTQRDGTFKNEKRYYACGMGMPDLDRMFVKPEVVSRTAGALMSKLFDEVVTLKPTRSGRGRTDPIVFGRIIDGGTGKSCAFLIAWFVDGADI